MFQGPLKIELMRDEHCYWRLTEPLVFDSEELGSITVPAGFCTNFASVPRLPVIYSLFGDTAHRAATLHDYLYCYDSSPASTYTQANDAFLEAMHSTGINRMLADAMWWAVSAFGFFFFHKHSINSNYDLRRAENEQIWNLNCRSHFDDHVSRMHWNHCQPQH